VLVAYAAIFVHLILGDRSSLARATTSQQRSLHGGALTYAFFRVLGDGALLDPPPMVAIIVYASREAGMGVRGSPLRPRRAAGRGEPFRAT